jgi:membrane associated rhomboid family serine protease
MIEPPRREKMFNVPAVVLVLVAALVLIHASLAFALTSEQGDEVLLLFAFIPARYDASLMADVAWPGGWAADMWTFVTYALLHGNVSHLAFNAVWLLAFGSPVAQRFGPVRFIAFLALSAAGGAGMHLVTHFGDLLPMIGASAAISGAMAAAIRFAFQSDGALAPWRDRERANRVPAASLLASLRNPRVLVFALLWFGSNIVFGLFATMLPGVEQAVAWQAHIGGFLVGLLAFSLFDPVQPAHHQKSDEKSAVA